MELRKGLLMLVRAGSGAQIEDARWGLSEADVAGLMALYPSLDDWESRFRVMDLLCDREEPGVDGIVREVLRLPGLNDQVRWVQAKVLGRFFEEHTNLGALFENPDRLAVVVESARADLGLDAVGPAEAGFAYVDLDEAAEAPVEVVPGDDPELALIQHARADRVEEVEALLAGGIDPDLVVDVARLRGAGEVVDDHVDGDPVLVHAVMERSPGAASALVAAGASVDVPRRIGGQRALWWAAGLGYEDLVAGLLEGGADPGAADSWGATPLHQAAAAGHVGIVARLLAAGAEVGAAQADGRTPLLYAVKGDRVEVLDLLVGAGAELGTVQGSFTPLGAAAVNGAVASTRWLAAAGVDLSDGGNGSVPLVAAAQGGHVAVVEALVAAGADPGVVDGGGRSAAVVATGRWKERSRAFLSGG